MSPIGPGVHPRPAARPGARRRRGVLQVACIAALLVAGAAGAQVCGNAIRESGEQCDDGNRASFDACSANCRFEQTQRVNQFALKSTSSAGCPSNALGVHAFVGTALQGTLNTALAGGIADGSVSVLLSFTHGLVDPTGAGGQPALQIGVLNGLPLPGSGYTGNSDVDWWYDVDDTQVDTSQVPASLLPGGILAGSLTAGPGPLLLDLDLGVPAHWRFSTARLSSLVGASSTPLLNNPGTVRGHLADENLDPELQSFATLTGGELCGNVSSASLAGTPVPSSLLSGGGISSCAEGYTATNSLLDVVVTGCKASFITQIVATQPDKTDPAAAPAGAGAPYTLIADAHHVVTGCQDSTKVAVDLTACLEASAYSVAFQFAADRVVIKSSAAQDIVFHDDFDDFP